MGLSFSIVGGWHGLGGVPGLDPSGGPSAERFGTGSLGGAVGSQNEVPAPDAANRCYRSSWRPGIVTPLLPESHL